MVTRASPFRQDAQAQFTRLVGVSKEGPFWYATLTNAYGTYAKRLIKGMHLDHTAAREAARKQFVLDR